MAALEYNVLVIDGTITRRDQRQGFPAKHPAAHLLSGGQGSRIALEQQRHPALACPDRKSDTPLGFSRASLGDLSPGTSDLPSPFRHGFPACCRGHRESKSSKTPSKPMIYCRVEHVPGQRA